MAKKEDKVTKLLSQIEGQLERQNSLWRVFTLGLFRGFGTALGATVLLAVITSIAIKLSSSLDLHSFMQYFLGDALSD